MKRTIAVFLTVALTFLFLIPSRIYAADNGNKFILSIYNETTGDYILENTLISLDDAATAAMALKYLSDKGDIISYSESNGRLTQIIYKKDDADVKISEKSGYGFSFKINGKAIDMKQGNGINSKLMGGDIVELVYDTAENGNGVSKTSIIESKINNSNYWTEDMSIAMNDACDRLLKTGGSSDFYLAATGAAGVTAGSQAVNDFIGSISSSDYDKSTYNMARNVMMLSFCGYGSEYTYIKNAIVRIAASKDISKDWIDEPIYVLYAYDMRHYTVPVNAVNTRQKVINDILEYQNSDGGFGRFEKSESSATYTAKALTALSVYKTTDKVKNAIDRGIAFLSDYIAHNNVTSNIIADTIIAMCSNDIDLKTIKPAKSKTLLEALLKYKNSDGGFSLELKRNSDDSATELAVIALAAVKKSGNPFVLLSDSDLERTHNDNSSGNNYIIVIVICGISAAAIATVTIFAVRRARIKKKNTLKDDLHGEKLQ